MSQSDAPGKCDQGLVNEDYSELNTELEQLLRLEYDEAKNHDFPEYHPYGEAIRRTLDAGILTFLSEKVIARHCFYICAEIIREEGMKGRKKPVYQHYIYLLKKLPTDWFDDKKGKLLDEIEVMN